MDAKSRRQELITEMAKLNASGFDCMNCTGACCTFRANSMQITELEAQDLKNFLVKEDRWNETLFETLKDCIKEFRLDVDIDPRGFRRTYTCPFFSGAKLGCTISREAKPYGCLAFNPREKGVTDGGNCRSDLELLERVPVNPEMSKLPIPQALLKLV